MPKSKRLKFSWQGQDIIVITIFLVLSFFQILTTNIKGAYSFTPSQVDQQIQRMNSYPPTLARLGYILENKKEVQFLGKVENNFFETIDFGNYFPNPFAYLLSPLVFWGIIVMIKQRKLVFYLFLTSICLLTIIGTQAKYGLVLMDAFLIYCLLLAGGEGFKLLKIKI